MSWRSAPAWGSQKNIGPEEPERHFFFFFFEKLEIWVHREINVGR